MKEDFYQFYLSQHQNRTCRRLHFVGTIIAMIFLVSSILTQKWILLIGALFGGYGPAWIGHFFFEKNRPATFKYPLKSFMSDFRMFYEILTRKIPW